ncbi:9161_t:CDS:2, partial [Acaulospora morrowiae]
ERIERVLRKVQKGQYGTKSVPKLTAPLNQSQNQGQEPSPPPLSPRSQNRTRISSRLSLIEVIPEEPELYPPHLKNLHSTTEELQSPRGRHPPNTIQRTRKRSSSATSNNSIGSNSSLNSVATSSTSTQGHSPVLDGNWILSDNLGLQELLILVRSRVDIIEVKERRQSGWYINDDPEKILEIIGTIEIREEIKEVYEGVNNELDELEQELDQIMENAIKAF